MPDTAYRIYVSNQADGNALADFLLRELNLLASVVTEEKGMLGRMKCFVAVQPGTKSEQEIARAVERWVNQAAA